MWEFGLLMTFVVGMNFGLTWIGCVVQEEGYRNPKTENVKSVMYGVYNKSKWRESYDV